MSVKRSGGGPASEDAKAILDRLRRLVRALRMFDRQAQTRHGLGAAQLFILHVLAQHDGISLGELAEHTATDQSSASIAASRLVEEGFVKRMTHDGDRRQVRLSVTAKGRALARRAPPAAQESLLDSAGQMTAGERRQLMELLDKLLARMN